MAGGDASGAAPDAGGEEVLTEKAPASVRAGVEHPFLRLKRLFGYAKVR